MAATAKRHSCLFRELLILIRMRLKDLHRIPCPSIIVAPMISQLPQSENSRKEVQALP